MGWVLSLLTSYQFVSCHPEVWNPHAAFAGPNPLATPEAFDAQCVSLRLALAAGLELPATGERFAQTMQDAMDTFGH